MAGEWRHMTLGDAIELKRGYDLPSRDRRDGPFHIVSSSGISGRHSEAKAKAPGVVIGRYGTLGEVHYITEDYWPLNTALYVRDFKGNDPRFVSYFLRSLDFTAYSDKAAVPGLNRNDLHTAQVSLPELPEQRAIAHILGTLDDKIELNRRMSETLEAMARALFNSWFVDFDPVRAKAEGREPAPPQPLADLFPDSFEDSELGEIPRGWEVKRLPELIEVNPPRSLRRGEIAPYLDMANMPTRGHSPDSVIERSFGSGMRFINGDTLVARITPCLENGKTAFVDFLAPGQIGWGSTEYIVLRSKPPLPAEFAYCLARSDGFRDFAMQSMTGSSGRQRVPAESLDHYLLTSCPEPIAHVFGSIAAPMFARASKASAESRTLAALRDTLLPKLISGEVRVKDAEGFLTERAL
jgi:type I restriction enzyme S subunit